MRHLVHITIATLAVVGCGGSQRVQSPPVGAKAEPTTASAPTPEAAPATAPKSPGVGNDFVLRDSESAKNAPGAKASKIQPTKTEAAVKFSGLEKEKGPVQGVGIALTSPGCFQYYTEETDADGYAEVLVPVGQKYELTYLSLGRKEIAASVTVSNEPNQNVKLTLRYKPRPPPPP